MADKTAIERGFDHLLETYRRIFTGQTDQEDSPLCTDGRWQVRYDACGYDPNAFVIAAEDPPPAGTELRGIQYLNGRWVAEQAELTTEEQRALREYVERQTALAPLMTYRHIGPPQMLDVRVQAAEAWRRGYQPDHIPLQWVGQFVVPPNKPKTSAEERAEKLLLSHMTVKQRRHYRKVGSFVIRSELGNYYLLHPKTTALLTSNHSEVVETLCATIGYFTGFPLADHLLARKLVLETDEAGFHLVANELRGWMPVAKLALEMINDIWKKPEKASKKEVVPTA